MERVQSSPKEPTTSSRLRSTIAAISLAVAGCAGAPMSPVVEVNATGKGTTVREFCYDRESRTCKVITRKDGELQKIEYIDCNSSKINGAACQKPNTIIYTPPATKGK